MSSKPPSTFELPFSPGFVLSQPVSGTPSDEVLSLFDECSRSLRRYTRSFGLGADAADDVVQEVFLSLFRHLQLGKPRHNLKGWLFQVAHNLALRQRKRQKRLEDVSAGDLSIAGQVPDLNGNPEEQLAEAEWRSRVHAILQTMPERDRRCMYLRAEGLCYRDIARVLGISLGSVAKSITRSLALLSQSSTE